jgi:hypothetical protein
MREAANQGGPCDLAVSGFAAGYSGSRAARRIFRGLLGQLDPLGRHFAVKSAGFVMA